MSTKLVQLQIQCVYVFKLLIFISLNYHNCMIPSQGKSQINSILSIYTRYSKNALNSFKFGDKKKILLQGVMTTKPH